MRQLSIPEYGRLARAELGTRPARDLQRIDEQHAGLTGETIFDWGHLHYIQAKSFVGVLQVPGLVVEILPKIDGQDEVEQDSRSSTEVRQQVRQNLLYMLSVSGHFSLFERELASQDLRHVPILEALMRVFVRRLLGELRRGQQHLYVPREENLTFVKGKILLQRQFTLNAAQHHRVYVSYDEFESDTWLNRILKAACVRLLSVTRLSRTEQYLRETLLELADVTECVIEPHNFDQVCLDRNSERFRELLDFCRLLFQGATPAAYAGDTPSFSLLFPMDVVFEEFVGAILKRHAMEFGFVPSEIHLQARNRSRWLLRGEDGAGRFRLKPDVLIDGPDGNPSLILDTKWKRLVSDQEDRKNGVSQSDVYQLYAYANRYNCNRNVLLYPQVPGASTRFYDLDGDESGKKLKIAFVDLNYDLRKARERLIENLRSVMQFH